MLALELGMPVGELSERMSAAEEVAWIAYYRESPFGDLRADMRNALVAQLIHNVNAGKGKSRKLQDFMLFQTKTHAPQQLDTKNIRSNFNAYIERQNARLKK